MDRDLYQHYTQAARDAYATGLACPVSAFDGDELTIVDRPESSPWYTVTGVTFGTGTVLSVAPDYREFAEANRPKKHYEAMSAAFLRLFADEAARRGQTLNLYSPSLCCTLCEQPPDIPVPRGYEVGHFGVAWMAEELQRGRFENGVGRPGEEGREFRNRFALVLYDARGEPAAVAGAFDTHGMLEIGVDVVRAHRGLGLGRLVVSALAREIVAQGKVPFYGCGATNIRSHRTAEASGFAAVCSDVFVSAPVP
jgi:GNAT superfamily N-acetyltransferase